MNAVSTSRQHVPERPLEEGRVARSVHLATPRPPSWRWPSRWARAAAIAPARRACSRGRPTRIRPRPRRAEPVGIVQEIGIRGRVVLVTERGDRPEYRRQSPGAPRAGVRRSFGGRTRGSGRGTSRTTSCRWQTGKDRRRFAFRLPRPGSGRQPGRSPALARTSPPRPHRPAPRPGQPYMHRARRPR